MRNCTYIALTPTLSQRERESEISRRGWVFLSRRERE
jgi:hypothetical protein